MLSRPVSNCGVAAIYFIVDVAGFENGVVLIDDSILLVKTFNVFVNSFLVLNDLFLGGLAFCTYLDMLCSLQLRMTMMLHSTHRIKQLSSTASPIQLSLLRLRRDLTKQLRVELGVDLLIAINGGIDSRLVEGRLRHSCRDSSARSLVKDQ
jgi:hypothetical protein